MKSSVIGTKELIPVSQSLYNKRYNTADVVHGVNFKKAFIDLSWDDFKNNLSWLLLNSLFSIYEGHLNNLKSKLSLLDDKDIKNLQFPERYEETIEKIHKKSFSDTMAVFAFIQNTKVQKIIR